jgi:hypothetical protein
MCCSMCSTLRIAAVYRVVCALSVLVVASLYAVVAQQQTEHAATVFFISAYFRVPSGVTTWSARAILGEFYTQLPIDERRALRHASAALA